MVPECSPLVSGADSGASAAYHRGLPPSDSASATDESFGFTAGLGGANISGGGGGGDDGWGSASFAGGLGRSSGGGGGGLGVGVGGRKDQGGAWLLAGAVKGLLGALVAAPGHPDLGPLYLLRGLLKAVRRQEWWLFVLLVGCFSCLAV